jgi:outer membrane protein TolC
MIRRKLFLINIFGNMNHGKILIIILFWVLVASPGITRAQQHDTVEISLDAFVKQGLENAGKIEFEREKVQMAELDVDRAEAQRILPRIQLSTQHGLVPGVESDSVLPGGGKLPQGQYYLDPDLENNWENWAIFTRAEVEAVQPLFTWGAIDNAIKAARAGARAAREEFEKQQSDYKLRLFELYTSYVLMLEVNRLLDNAQSQIDKIEENIKEMEKDKDASLDQSEVYKFQVYKSRFQMRAAEVRHQANFIERTWSEVLQPADSVAYELAESFLDTVRVKFQKVQHYKKQALQTRHELQRIEAGIKAAEYGLEAQKSEALPSLFLGLSASYANTPNRPRQDNPFIINNSNYATASFGLGIRQNLNLQMIHNKITSRRLQYEQAQSLKDAAKQGIKVEINEKYKEASLSEAKMNYTDDALLTSKKWLRQEQLDYDLGMGEVKDLIESLKTKLEMEVELKQRIFDYNNEMAELYHSAGIPLQNLKYGSK